MIQLAVDRIYNPGLAADDLEKLSKSKSSPMTPVPHGSRAPSASLGSGNVFKTSALPLHSLHLKTPMHFTQNSASFFNNQSLQKNIMEPLSATLTPRNYTGIRQNHFRDSPVSSTLYCVDTDQINAFKKQAMSI